MILAFTPTSAQMCATTHVDVMALQAHWKDAISCQTGLGMSNVADRLNAVAQIVMDQNYSHLCVIEADMRVTDPNVVTRMAKRHVHVIGANYRKRQDDGWTCQGLDGQMLSSRGKTGMEEVARVGCGLMLIDARVFRSFAWPWFSWPLDPVTRMHRTPDYFFCNAAREHGHRIFVDHDASQSVRHTANVELGVDDLFYVESQQPVRLT